MLITKPKIRHLCTIVSAAVGLLAWTMIASAEYHADSAHGNVSYGVNRSGTMYPTGDCAHCHDTFDDSTCTGNAYMLFAQNNPQSQTDNFCFQCHKGTGSVQEGGIVNYNYGGEKFGGGSNEFTNVYDQFNASTSSHDLAALLNWVVTNHPEWGFTLESNPCTICHIPHKARANWRNPQAPTYTAIRLPGEHASNPGNLWGDDSNERMNNSPKWNNQYEAPYYKSIGNDGYEPGGTMSTDGSQHPDYATLCQDCHSEINVTGFNYPIDWENQLGLDAVPKHGECNLYLHGMGNPNLDYPWRGQGDIDRTLSCLDCHEPHGSSNPYILRITMNGHTGLTYGVNDMQSQIDWCDACHTGYNYTDDYQLHCMFASEGCDPCSDCHTHGPREDGTKGGAI